MPQREDDMRAWVAPLRGMQLAQRGHGPHLTAVQQAWDRIAAAHATVNAHPDRDTLLPADARFPRIHSRLHDGHAHASKASSAVVCSHSFLALYDMERA